MPGKESYIQIPPDSGGRKVRTLIQTKDGFEVHEEVYRFALHLKAELPAYAVCALDQAVAANKCHFECWNKSGSNLWLEVIRIVVANSSGNLGMRLGWTTDPSAGGTALTPAKLDISNPDLPALIPITTNATLVDTGITQIASLFITAGRPAILFDEKKVGQPLLVKEDERFGVWQYATVGAGTVDIAVIFRTRPKE